MMSETKQLIEGQSEGTRKKISEYIGYLCGIINAVAVSIAGGGSQALGEGVPSFELCAFRYMLNFVCTALIVFIFRLSPRIERASIPFLAIYIVCDLSINITLYVSLKYISLTTMLCLKQLIQTVVALAIDFIMTRSCNVAHMASACMCLVGTLMLTQPRFIFGSLLSRDMISAGKTHPLCFPSSARRFTEGLWESDQYNHSTPEMNNMAAFTISDVSTLATEMQEGPSESVLYPGYILGCITPLLVLCMIYNLNRRLSHVNPFVTVFWTSLIGSVVMAGVMGMLEAPDFPSGAMCLGFMFVHLIGVFVNSVCFAVVSMKLAPIITVLLFTLDIAIGLIAQYTVLKNINPGHENFVEILGVLAVIVGNVITPPSMNTTWIRQRVLRTCATVRRRAVHYH